MSDNLVTFGSAIVGAVVALVLFGSKHRHRNRKAGDKASKPKDELPPVSIKAKPRVGVKDRHKMEL